MLGLNGFEMFCAMCVLHYLCDYALQGDFMARAKNPKAPIDGVPWDEVMHAHGIIHGGAVWLVTGCIWLGFAEWILHAVIDLSKCHGHIGYRTDQRLHLGCKLLWGVLAWWC